jgi:hypothetical protein
VGISHRHSEIPVPQQVSDYADRHTAQREPGSKGVPQVVQPQVTGADGGSVVFDQLSHVIGIQPREHQPILSRQTPEQIPCDLVKR